MMYSNVLALLSVVILIGVTTDMPRGDLINGTFEFCGGFAIYLSIRNLHRAKIVRGVSWAQVAFFSSWGCFNLWFYPSINQWFSFAGGLFLVTMNSIWLTQIAYYLRKEKLHVNV